MQHNKWTSKGRLFDYADQGQPNRFRYKSSSGQRNVDIGNGTFAPYVWESSQNTVKFAEGEFRLTATRLEYWYDKSLKCALSFHPEIKDRGIWERKAPIINGLTVEHIDTGNSKATCNLTYKINTADAEATITVIAGYNRKVTVGADLEAKIAGEQQIILEADRRFTPIERIDDITKEQLPPIRMDSGDFSWIWADDEAEDREIEHTLTESKIALLHKDYQIGEISTVKPDTFGGSIGADADDGYDDGTDWELKDGSNYIRLSDGRLTNNCSPGFSFEIGAIASGSTINECYMRAYIRNYSNAGPAGPEVAEYGLQDVDPASQDVWSQDDQPRNATFTSSSRGPEVMSDISDLWSSRWIWGENDENAWNFANDLQDLVNSYGAIALNDRINFGMKCGDDANAILYLEDYEHSGTNEAEIDIDWTEAAVSVSATDLKSYLQLSNQEISTDLKSYLNQVNIEILTDLKSYLFSIGEALTDLKSYLNRIGVVSATDLKGYLISGELVSTDLKGHIRVIDKTIETDLKSYIAQEQTLDISTDLKGHLLRIGESLTDIKAYIQRVDIELSTDLKAYTYQALEVFTDLKAYLRTVDNLVTGDLKGYLNTIDNLQSTDLKGFLYEAEEIFTDLKAYTIGSIASLTDLKAYINQIGVLQYTDLRGYLVGVEQYPHVCVQSAGREKFKSQGREKFASARDRCPAERIVDNADS